LLSSSLLHEIAAILITNATTTTLKFFINMFLKFFQKYSKTIRKQENLHLITWVNTLQKALKRY
jgi:hypothetical protein